MAKNQLLLLLLIHSGWGCFVAYDTIGALSPVLKKALDMNNTQIGILYSCYSIGSVLLSLMCGVLVDKFGPGRMLMVTTAVNSVGTAIVAAAPNFVVMLLGELLYGLGSAPLYITIVTTLETWFHDHPKHRLFTTMPLIEQKANFRVALWVSCGTCVSSFVSALSFYLLYKAPPTYREIMELEGVSANALQKAVEHEGEPTVSKGNIIFDTVRTEIAFIGKNLKNLPLSYWCVSTIYVWAIPSIYTFSAFGTIILVNHGFKMEDAAFTTSLISLTNALTSPFIGAVVGHMGKRTYVAIGGTALLTFLYLSFLNNWMQPLAIFILIGFVQSISDTLVFPSISIVVKPHVAGMATGFMMLWYDTFLALAPVIVGVLQDYVANWITLMIFILMGGVTFVSSLVLKYSDIRANNILDNTQMLEKKTMVTEFTVEDALGHEL